MTRGALYLLFTASGFAGLIYESIWTNYLKLFLGHAAYAQSLVLVVFMGGMAAGAAWCGKRSVRMANPLMAYAAVEALVGLAALVFHAVFVALTDFSRLATNGWRSARSSACRACSSCRSRCCSVRLFH